MTYCGICGDDDHNESQCELRLGAPLPDQDGLLPQHRRCWTCKQITHIWDRMPCGKHSVPGADMTVIDAPPVTPPRSRTHDLRALALAQAAEARAERGADLDTWWRARMAREREQLQLPVPDHADSQDQPRDQPGTGQQGSQQQPRQ